MSRPATLGELRASGWESRPVKEELRANVVRCLTDGCSIVPGTGNCELRPLAKKLFGVCGLSFSCRFMSGKISMAGLRDMLPRLPAIDIVMTMQSPKMRKK